MSYYLSVKNKKNNFTGYEVPEEIYIYVKQLEAYINFPNESKLLEAYPDRFAVGTNRLLCEQSADTGEIVVECVAPISSNEEGLLLASEGLVMAKTVTKEELIKKYPDSTLLT